MQTSRSSSQACKALNALKVRFDLSDEQCEALRVSVIQFCNRLIEEHLKP